MGKPGGAAWTEIAVWKQYGSPESYLGSCPVRVKRLPTRLPGAPPSAEARTTELNLADVLGALNVEFTPVLFEKADQATSAYDDGACDAFTADKSGLAGNSISLRNPSDHMIMDATISKEPLGPAVLHGDDQWFDVVKWVVFGLFMAEEFGIGKEAARVSRSGSGAWAGGRTRRR